MIITHLLLTSLQTACGVDTAFEGQIVGTTMMLSRVTCPNCLESVRV